MSNNTNENSDTAPPQCKKGHPMEGDNACWHVDKRSKDGGRWECKTCRRASACKSTKKHRAANPEKRRTLKREQAKRYRAKYPEKVKASRAKWREKTRAAVAVEVAA